MRYKIIGIYRNTPEVIDTADSLVEAKRLVCEYQMAFGNKWIIGYNKNDKYDTKQATI